MEAFLSLSFSSTVFLLLEKECIEYYEKVTPTCSLFRCLNGIYIQHLVTGKLSTKELELAQSLAINLPKYRV